MGKPTNKTKKTAKGGQNITHKQKKTKHTNQKTPKPTQKKKQKITKKKKKKYIF
ncbi:hypothetical protein [Staphylococcus aureus]|uniref:hypothetical protein n=1 Tax=Staphylococcus aureus TaxID=1280 RepID=UPI00210EFB87|nr:hypothetical protein [Staphylococcus aureus]